MFVEIGLSLFHLFPHRVDVSPLGQSPDVVKRTVFSEMLIKLLPDPTGSASCRLVCLEGGCAIQAVQEPSFPPLTVDDQGLAVPLAQGAQ